MKKAAKKLAKKKTATKKLNKEEVLSLGIGNIRGLQEALNDLDNRIVHNYSILQADIGDLENRVNVLEETNHAISRIGQPEVISTEPDKQ